MKDTLLALAGILSQLWRIVPAPWREKWITGWMILDSRGDSATGLRQLLGLRDRLDWVISERAMVYGGGEHQKHRLTNYHRFFIDNIRNGDRVIDVGCGYGTVARSIARAYPNCVVVGIDQDKGRISQALVADNPDNLSFIEGDATCALPVGAWQVVVLSNVLEHIETRIDFLKKIKLATLADRILIRVPLFERDWLMPLRRELSVNYFSDSDHKIEHTYDEFIEEIKASGLTIVSLKTFWGEIWAHCEPISIE